MKYYALKYSFGRTKAFIKVKTNKAIDVKSRFAMNGGKCDNELVTITIRGVVATTEKL